MYTEEFQFIDRTHMDKEEALENKAAADGYRRRAGGPAFRTAPFDFAGLARKHELGMTFRRLPSSAGTRFVFLDIDRKQNPDLPPVTMRELDSALSSMGYADYMYTHSTSVSEGNWHVFLLLDDTVSLSGSAYRDAHDAAAGALSAAIATGRGTEGEPAQLCDPAMRSPFQLMYGLPARPSRIMVDGMSAPHLERTAEFPEPRWVDNTQDVRTGWNCRRVPTSPGEFARVLRDAGVIPDSRIAMEYAFDAWLPFMRKGGSRGAVRISEGERHTALNMFAFKLYCCYRAANLYASEHGFLEYTEDDLKGTFLALTKGASGGDASAVKEAMRSLMGIHGRGQGMSDLEWCRENSRYAIRDADGNTRHHFRTKDHCRNETDELLECRADSGVARFRSREDLESELRSRGLSEATFRRHARAAGVSVEVASVSRGGRPAGSASVSLEDVLGRISGTVEGNVVMYSGEVSRKDRNLLARRGYRLKKLTRQILTH